MQFGNKSNKIELTEAERELLQLMGGDQDEKAGEGNEVSNESPSLTGGFKRHKRYSSLFFISHF